MNWFVAVVFVASVLTAQVDAGGKNVYCRYEVRVFPYYSEVSLNLSIVLDRN